MREALLDVLNSMNDTDVEMLSVGLTATCALTKGTYGDALRSGAPLLDPPTDIIGDTPRTPQWILDQLAASDSAATST